MKFYSIGHSRRALDEFLRLLERNHVEMLLDIRSFPHSPRNPQFDIKSLAPALEATGIGYRHLPALGGRRSRSLKVSPNQGWREPAFRNFADYMQTDAFEKGLNELIDISRGQRTAYMCAEAVPWRCHRQLLSDSLVARGHEVFHIIGAAPARPHRLTPFAKVEGNRVTYPGEPSSTPG